jgi:hypothetical protein
MNYSDNPLGRKSPPPCRGRARVGVDSQLFHRFNPHPSLTPEKGKELALFRVFEVRN